MAFGTTKGTGGKKKEEKEEKAGNVITVGSLLNPTLACWILYV